MKGVNRMANEVVITTQALMDKFQYALNENYGYIYGAAGELWTATKQASATREQTVKYGKQWICHYVADCSGLFTWAFKQLGGYMYHGSNTMYLQYCTAKGKLKNGKREDGQELKPGTAVFVWKEKDQKYGHVGLYMGNGIVIEAASTQKGVITSKVTDTKWSNWGELKGVDYGVSPTPVPEGYAVVTGKRVALRTAPTTQASIIMRIDTGNTVKIETPPPSEWEYVSYKGKTGYMMKEFLKEL